MNRSSAQAVGRGWQCVPWHGLGCLILSGVLGWSGVVKALDPEAFAVAVGNFQLVGGVTARAVAYYLPWMEIALAVGLCLPRWRTAALGLAAGLLTAFAILWAVTWARGLNVECGCFGGTGTTSAAWAFTRVSLLAGLAWVALALRSGIPHGAACCDRQGGR